MHNGEPPPPPGVVTMQPGYGPPAMMPMQPFSHPITVQPGLQPGQVASHTAVYMPMPNPIEGVPPGLEYLSYVDSLIVYQLKELIEIVTNWETKNKYVLKNANGDQIYYAFEESECCERQCCGPQRGFTMHIVDNFQEGSPDPPTALQMLRRGLLRIRPPRDIWARSVNGSPAVPRLFHLLDANNTEILKIDGPCCCLMMGCQDKEFPVSSLSDQTIGAIKKRWGGCFREAITDADVFSVDFPIDMDVKMKAVMLAATFLIDFMEFETPQNNNN
ncbi:unnamed protein product [Caenorhabditis auriculariae]|uniref:Phospholipid scramblase n=1 Tax=Caenorhabditis auriculariae TaxID=2777116 RepID=A0A8S1H2C7_9PELO|nr:unnamed protein product [Caenorhabditis auriculariae]